MLRLTAAFVIAGFVANPGVGQDFSEEQDKVEELMQEVERLRAANAQLLETIDQMKEQTDRDDLSNDPATASLKMRRILDATESGAGVSVPAVTLKSKAVDDFQAIAVLGFGGTSLRVRPDVEVLIPVADGQLTSMKVTKIDMDVVQLEFPQLEQTVWLYD